MKHRTALIVVILVLAAALLIGACLFFFVFRKDLTASVLVYWADRFEQSGRYNRTITLYRQAEKLTPEDEDIPRLLAKAYQLSGNFTKAEYTLVSAITREPESVELYAELSRVYLAQDKLLDAEQMLGRITSTDVKSQIDALRPATPVFSPETGYYTEYIDVTVTSGGSPVYVTLNEDYPSIATDTYTGPITLGGGESKLVAIAVGSNGLVSDAAYGGYTVGNVVEPVTLEDSALDTLVRELLGKTAADTIMTDELWEISELVLPDNMTTLNDLTRFAGLKQLSLHSANDLDLTQLASISTLESLDLSGCTISSSALAAICTLPELKSLNLSGCALADIAPLVALTGLQTLDLTDNTASDITALSALTELRELHLTNNPIKSITYLNNCLSLERLYIENCGIVRLSGIAGNASLQELYCSGNEIADLSVLSGCTALRVLDVSDNQIKDISLLAELPALEEFNGDNNQITAIPDFDETTSPLWRFSVNHNEIESLEGLAGIDNLNFVLADYNKIKDITVLESCRLLCQLDVWDNPIDQDGVKTLQDGGVIVNFNKNYKEDTAE